MEDYIVERSSLRPQEVGLDDPRSRFSLSFPDTEHTFSGEIKGLVIGIGNPDTTPPMLVMGNTIYCPTGFGYMDQETGKQTYFIKAGKVGRAKHFPLTKNGRVDQTISRQHLIIENEENGQITVRNMGQNGTSVAEVPMIKEMEGGIFNLKRGAVAFDASEERRITLTVGQNNKVELIIDPDGVKIGDNKYVIERKSLIDPLNKALSFLGMQKIQKFFILRRKNINPTDLTISLLHLSIIFDPTTERYYLFDHSTNGTTVELAERQNQSQESPVREEGKVENVRTPQWILKEVGHQEQQIPGDPNSVGGDYYLFGRQVVSEVFEGNKEYLLKKGGDAAVLMDTATVQTGGETPKTTTKPFAQKFLEEYYRQIAQGKDPEKAMKEAYENTYNSNNVRGRTLGERTEATFTFVTVVGDTAYCLWVGNTEAVLVRKGEVVEKIASKKGMVYESYYDNSLNMWVSPTVLVASGRYEKTGLVKLSPGDEIYVYTDGVKQLNPRYPKKSLLGQDDAVIVKL